MARRPRPILTPLPPLPLLFSHNTTKIAEDEDISPEHVSASVRSKVDISTVREAAAATDAEHSMFFVKSFKL
ncbi:hypothetical protein CCMA1212_009167 [Trichoderma ghanense]|uniref:Uncharacterized protein n=1 Tax=Trichoderma ghanense TaxID=65468 RepID=A0ABY2GUU6_9HYPO